MRLAILALILGILIGCEAHSLVADHPAWFRAAPRAREAGPEAARVGPVVATKPRYPSVEKVLANLRQSFDEAVVVALADESIDDAHQLVRISLIEVWKGPGQLAGKSMDCPLEPPLSYRHSQTKDRVLVFLPLTPRISSHRTVFFSGGALRMNPALTVRALRAAFLQPTKTAETK